MHADRSVSVQLSNAGSCDQVTTLAHIIRAQKELGGKVCDGHGGRVKEGEALDAGQGDILCDLDAQALETDDEHMRGAHALHGFVAQNIELSAVEGLVDLIVTDGRFVDLHPGDEVDLGVG